MLFHKSSFYVLALVSVVLWCAWFYYALSFRLVFIFFFFGGGGGGGLFLFEGLRVR